MTIRTEAAPVQQFLERVYALRDGSQEKLEWDTYQAMVDVAKKHHISYGESNVQELIHYLDGLSKLGGMHPNSARVIRDQANDLQRRLNGDTEQ